jgi:hypothetical protein
VQDALLDIEDCRFLDANPFFVVIVVRMVADLHVGRRKREVAERVAPSP